jgi:transposase
MSKYSQKTKDQDLHLFKIEFGIHSVANPLDISRYTIKNSYSNTKNNSSLSRKMSRRIFSVEFKRKVIETRWQNKFFLKKQ